MTTVLDVASMDVTADDQAVTGPEACEEPASEADGGNCSTHEDIDAVSSKSGGADEVEVAEDLEYDDNVEADMQELSDRPDDEDEPEPKRCRRLEDTDDVPESTVHNPATVVDTIADVNDDSLGDDPFSVQDGGAAADDEEDTSFPFTWPPAAEFDNPGSLYSFARFALTKMSETLQGARSVLLRQNLVDNEGVGQRISTVFSGTEVYALASEAAHQAMSDHTTCPGFGLDEYVFTCDSDSNSQKFLVERGFETVFKDAAELTGSCAFCVASGGVKTIGPVDKTVAGWVCADYSFQNPNRGRFTESIQDRHGKSSQTFHALADYLGQATPTIFIGENVSGMMMDPRFGADVVDKKNDNVEHALQVLREKGYEATVRVACPRNVGIPCARRRVYFFAIHVKQYLDSVQLGHAFNNEAEARVYVSDLACTWGASFAHFAEPPFNKPVEWPQVPLAAFLADDGSDYVACLREEAQEKDKTIGNKSQRGEGWKKQHQKKYEKAGVQYMDVNNRGDQYSDNDFYKSATERERCSILYWDTTVTPPTPGNEQNVDTSQSLCRQKVTEEYLSYLLPKGHIWLRQRARFMGGAEKMNVQGISPTHSLATSISDDAKGLLAGQAFNGYMMVLIELALYMSVPLKMAATRRANATIDVE
eukprot:TRINITY_DN21630_c0_g2_i1.p1 TRINITY_DN21630_c0_g2~~TRINITY_DN21630_c0_g2_i1.p1  ORF type:complete len:649 (+),score=146.65 TRINITY_DN21630_c0_g2_i1:70-2016(+)